MTPIQIGIMGIVVLAILLAVRAPAGISLVIAAALGGSLLTSPGLALAELGGNILRIVSHYDLSVVPLLILTCLAWANPGSRAAGCRPYILLSNDQQPPAKTGISSSDDQQPPAKTGISRAAGCRPYILLPVVFAFLAGISTGRFLMAGVIPGIIVAVLLILTVIILKLFAPRRLPDPLKSLFSFRLKTHLYFLIIPVVAIIIVAGIFFGLVTPTEAFAVGAFISLLFMAVSRRLTRKGLVEISRSSVVETVRVFVLITGGRVFGVFLTRSLFHVTLTQFSAGAGIPPFLVLGFILFLYTVMGFVFDGLAALVIVTPFAYPIITGLGYSGNWFGILAILALMPGTLARGRAAALPADNDAVRSVREVVLARWPFWTAMLAACMIVAAIPETVTLLPRLTLGM